MNPMHKDELIKKWLNNELSEEEQKAFDALEDSGFNSYLVNYAEHFKASHHSAPDDFKSFKSQYDKFNKQKQPLNNLKPLLRIAAVVIVTLGLYFTFINSSKIVHQTMASEKTTISLPDASTVQLNALSRLAYDKDSWDAKRQVTLDGEAYFKVAKGSIFDVKTSAGVVTVVGTEFNVKQRTNFFEVQCFEGIVKVVSDTIVRQLTAGHTYRILNHQFSESITSALLPEWTKNKSSFSSVPLQLVIAELERQYNVKVELNQINTSTLFSGSFTHDNLEDALKAISIPTQLQYQIETDQSVILYED